MPWELTVRSKTVSSGTRTESWPLLGEASDVRRCITESVPSVEWRREPSFIEQHQHLPVDSVMRRFIDESTAEQKRMLSLPELVGLYEGDGFTLEFALKDAPVTFFHIDVRGDGNPCPLLGAMCRSNEWAVEDVGHKLVDLDSPAASGWESFTKWRDQAVDQMMRDRKRGSG